MLLNGPARCRPVRSAGTCVAAFALAALSLAGCHAGGSADHPAGTSSTLSGPVPPTPVINPGIHKIKHVVVIMQENRSFDSFFGTYPGADGIPMQNGVPAVCLPDPQTGRCVRPFHDRSDLNLGSVHNAAAARYDIAGGKMNGFVAEARRAPNTAAGQSTARTAQLAAGSHRM